MNTNIPAGRLPGDPCLSAATLSLFLRRNRNYDSSISSTWRSIRALPADRTFYNQLVDPLGPRCENARGPFFPSIP
jgi:hypothetical protein